MSTGDSIQSDEYKTILKLAVSLTMRGDQMIAYSHELYTLYTGCDFHRPSQSHQPPRPRGWAVPWGEPGDGQESGRGAAAADRHWGRTGGRDLVFYQSVYVMLGSVFRGGHFKHIGRAQQCLLRLSVCHHLPQTNTNWMLEYYYTNSINNVVRLYTGQSSFFLHQLKKTFKGPSCIALRQ